MAHNYKAAGIHRMSIFQNKNIEFQFASYLYYSFDFEFPYWSWVLLDLQFLHLGQTVHTPWMEETEIEEEEKKSTLMFLSLEAIS